jgi:predicted DCC family thiol-disulfide oxidoreductase YuxK
MTEATERSGRIAPNGVVLYDGDCAICRAGALRFGPLLRRHGFALAPLQEPWVARTLPIPEAELLREMRLLSPTGEALGGVEALLHIARRICWARPAYALAHLPGVRPLLRRLYRCVAERRHCLGGACRVERDCD